MEGFVIAGCVVAVAGLVFLAAYGVPTRGLSDARVGEIYNFVYEQPLEGDPERYLAKVLGIQMLDDNSIRRLNRRSNYRRNDPEFKRTRNLVTCRTSDGKVRNFYAERTRSCRKPLLGKMLFGTKVATIL